MQLKKYKVNNIKEAMDRIKEELGEDAFILSNKTIREGGREWLEIMAAVARESASPPFRASAETLLLLLYAAPEGRLRMGELASGMVFSPSRITYQVKTLVARGLIERRAASVPSDDCILP